MHLLTCLLTCFLPPPSHDTTVFIALITLITAAVQNMNNSLFFSVPIRLYLFDFYAIFFFSFRNFLLFHSSVHLFSTRSSTLLCICIPFQPRIQPKPGVFLLFSSFPSRLLHCHAILFVSGSLASRDYLRSQPPFTMYIWCLVSQPSMPGAQQRCNFGHASYQCLFILITRLT